MGFNARLAPYTLTFQTNAMGEASGTHDIDWFRFPFAGELLAAYGAVGVNIATDTSTAITTLAVGKSLAGTGAYAAASSRVVVAAASGSTYDPTTQYTLTNSTTVSEVRFAAGDWAMLRIINAQSSAGVRPLTVQMDYVIGYSAA